MRILNNTRQHKPVVAVCMKNAAAPGRKNRTVKQIERNDTHSLPMEIPKDSEPKQRERMVGMANRALKGSAATMLLASSFPEDTRAVIYTEPMVIAQLPRNKQIANALAITDCLISTRSA